MRIPAVRMSSTKSSLNVLVIGALSQTGQLVARSLASNGFDVTAFCEPLMIARLEDDSGSLIDTKVRPFQGGRVANIDAVVIATDDAPPPEDLEYLLQQTRSVPHTVLLSRIGASKGAFGVGKWKEVEEKAASSASGTTTTIIRCGEPLIGGPYYALNPDLIAKGNAEVADQWRGCRVEQGDGSLKQGGFGTSRLTAANAIECVLRRGCKASGGVASYSVVSLETSDGRNEEVVTAQAWDAKFTQASGGDAGGTAAGGSSAVVALDIDDERLQSFTQPQEMAAANPLAGPLAASGPYWATLLLFIYGAYLTTTPEYIQATGNNYWGL